MMALLNTHHPTYAPFYSSQISNFLFWHIQIKCLISLFDKPFSITHSSHVVPSLFLKISVKPNGTFDKNKREYDIRMK